MSKSRIEKTLHRDFPVVHSFTLGKVALDSPRVYFSGTKIGAVVRFSGTFMGAPVGGRMNFNGTVLYNRNNYSFYITDVTIVSLNVNAARFTRKNRLAVVLLEIIGRFVEDCPIYRLDRNDFREHLAAVYLKEVKVKNDRLVLILEKQ